ncbi:Integrase catalytic domain-containing protein [Abeliophyllum distichum]|uniref:Integrase catalytic domain-containing protein n=1 Tax=Abeliophyllum distichum TaxID=126358 RepID=A0ABD1TIG3_9LAMI
MSSFEIVYGFNPLTPLDLIPLPVDERTSLDGHRKADMVKHIHNSVRQQIEKKNEQYAAKANKGRRQVILEPGDWVWVHMRKERFPARRCSKLHLRGYGPFQVLERINNNAYKPHLLDEFNVSATFNISDLSPFDAGDDSMSNLFKEGGDDASHELDANHGPASHDSTHISIGTLTRSRAKKIKEDIQSLVQTLWANADIKNKSMTNEVPTWIHLIQAKERIEDQFERETKSEDKNAYGTKICTGKQGRTTMRSHGYGSLQSQRFNSLQVRINAQEEGQGEGAKMVLLRSMEGHKPQVTDFSSSIKQWKES